MKQVTLQNAAVVYEGLLDDKVAQFPWGRRFNPGYLDEILRLAALHQRQLLINDGYLLHRSWAREALLDPKGLLRGLMSSQHWAMFCRNEELECIPELMAKSVPSYQSLLDKPTWGETKQRLRRLRRSSDYRWAKWPIFDNRHGFTLLVQNFVVGQSPAVLGIDEHVPQWQLEKTLDQFFVLRERDPMKGARSQWEDAVSQCTLKGDEARAQLMHLGNELYHYNMGALVAAASSADVSVSTRFSVFLAQQFVGGNRPDPPGHLRVPAKLMRLSVPKFVRIFRDDEVCRAKETYLDTLEAWSCGQSSASKLNDTIIDYSQAIERAYRDLATEKREKILYTVGTIGAAAGLAAAGAFLAAPALAVSPFVLAGIAAGGTGVGGVSTAHLVALWRGRKMRNAVRSELSPDQLKVKTAMTIARPTVTIRLDAAAVGRFAAKVKKLEAK